MQFIADISHHITSSLSQLTCTNSIHRQKVYQFAHNFNLSGALCQDVYYIILRASLSIVILYSYLHCVLHNPARKPACKPVQCNPVLLSIVYYVILVLVILFFRQFQHLRFYSVYLFAYQLAINATKKERRF